MRERNEEIKAARPSCLPLHQLAGSLRHARTEQQRAGVVNQAGVARLTRASQCRRGVGLGGAIGMRARRRIYRCAMPSIDPARRHQRHQSSERAINDDGAAEKSRAAKRRAEMKALTKLSPSRAYFKSSNELSAGMF